MKNTLKVLSIIAFVSVFTISVTACFSQSGGGEKILNSPEALKKYLDSQPANSPDKPIKISMGVNEIMLPKIRDVLNSAGKYVSLNLTGNALTTIPENAFYDEKTRKGCETLVGITIPNSVTIIREGAFFCCTSLTGVTIPDSVDLIGRKAFFYCTRLNNVTIPNSVISIGEDAFSNCTSLISVTIPNSVVGIGNWAFFGCTSLTSVTFATGSNITNANFGYAAFPEENSKKGADTLKTAYSERPYYKPLFGKCGDTLKSVYITGKAGTYTRTANGYTWTKTTP
jgi:hypothetical protein